MEHLMRVGATSGVIGFIAVIVFLMCCVAALALMGLAGWIARKIGGDDDDETHKPRSA